MTTRDTSSVSTPSPAEAPSLLVQQWRQLIATWRRKAQQSSFHRELEVAREDLMNAELVRVLDGMESTYNRCADELEASLVRVSPQQEREGDLTRVDLVPDGEHGDLPRPVEGRREG